MTKPLHIAMLSHLVWERSLFQRPQQLATQFAAAGDRVEYHALMASRRWLRSPTERRLPFAEHGLATNHPFLPGSGRVPALGAMSLRRLVRAAGRFLRAAPAGRRVLWLQHPGYFPHIEGIARDLLVYDCMDPFAAFQKTESWAPQAEDRLLSEAGVVFTGGRALHAAREGKSMRMHCFPSGIDFEHFALGAEKGSVAEELQNLPRPVFGYVGAVDERIDWKLVEALCRGTEGSVAFVGPVLEGAGALPEAANFHAVGGRPYERLPEYLRGFDVCLIPWKVNELTKFMSPTKTPEYLASGRPVVSSPIPDVMADYPEEVAIADSPDAFTAACIEAAERGTGPARKPPQARTWKETADEMCRLMEESIAR